MPGMYLGEMLATITLPFPPSVNTYWRTFHGRTVLSAAGRDFKLETKAIIVNERVQSFGEQKLSVKMVLRPRDKRRIDIDNRIKAVLDALQDAGVFTDDFQVDYLQIERGEPMQGGCVVVTIETLNEGEQK